MTYEKIFADLKKTILKADASKLEGKFAFQIPFNAEPGNWQAVITHCASGKKTSKTFKVIK